MIRHYSPETGRFLSEDPIGQAGGLNLYGYVDQDPILRADAFGLSTYCENLARRKAINRGIFRGGAKFVASAVVGASIMRELSKVGLGIGFFTVLKNWNSFWAISSGGALANACASFAIKTIAVGGAFYVGYDVIGNRLGAMLDTMTDNDVWSALNNYSFGSDSYNKTPQPVFQWGRCGQ